MNLITTIFLIGTSSLHGENRFKIKLTWTPWMALANSIILFGSHCNQLII